MRRSSSTPSWKRRTKLEDWHHFNQDLLWGQPQRQCDVGKRRTETTHTNTLNWPLTRRKGHSVEEVVFSVKGTRSTRVPHANKQRKWIIELNVKCKTIELLGDNIGESGDNFNFGDDFFRHTTKALSIKEKNWEVGLH